VPPVFELSCAPIPPTIINHTGAHPCRKVQQGEAIIKLHQPAATLKRGVTFRSINLRPDEEVVTAERLVGQK